MHALPRLRLCVVAALVWALCSPAVEAAPNFGKYPLRINILNSTTNAYWINPALGGPMADVGGMAAAAGDEGAPAMPMGGGLSLSYDPVQMFYGSGKANLVSPTEPTLQGMTFTYDFCMNRLGMTLPDKPLSARWKKKDLLEVLVPLPSTKVPKPGAKPAAIKYDKCDVAVVIQKYVYLLLQSGAVVGVTAEDLAKKPSLKQFTVGLDPKLLPRKPAAAAAPAAPARRAGGRSGRSGASRSSNPGSAASDSSPSSRQPSGSTQ